MNDMELLKLSAKAAGLVGTYRRNEYGDEGMDCPDGSGGFHSWNPLTDDGDALRLSAKLLHNIEYVTDERPSGEIGVMRRTVNMPATRRAIVLAAAEIGRRM